MDLREYQSLDRRYLRLWKPIHIETNQFSGTLHTYENFLEIEKRFEEIGDDLLETRMYAYPARNSNDYIPVFGYKRYFDKITLKEYLAQLFDTDPLKKFETFYDEEI